MKKVILAKPVTQINRAAIRSSAEKGICFIGRGSVNGRVDSVIKLNKVLFEHLSRVYQQMTFIDVSRVFTTAWKFGGSTTAGVEKLLPSDVKYLCPADLSEFSAHLKSSQPIVLCGFSEYWYDWYLHYYLKKHKIPLIYVHTMSEVLRFEYNVSKASPILKRLLIRLKTLVQRFFRRYVINRLLITVGTFFISRKDEADRLRKTGEYGAAEIVVTNSRVYDNFLMHQYSVTREYIVFLDSMLPYHRDQLTFGYALIDRESYYVNLKRVLDFFELASGKEAVVCLHPKYDMAFKERDFGRRKTFKFRADEMLARADWALFHNSSAINSAVLHQKKIIQLTGNCFNEFIKKNLATYQDIFAFPTIDIYEDTEAQMTMTIENYAVNKEKYDAFLDNAIIASGEEGVSSAEQIVRHLNQKYQMRG